MGEGGLYLSAEEEKIVARVQNATGLSRNGAIRELLKAGEKPFLLQQSTKVTAAIAALGILWVVAFLTTGYGAL